MASMKTFISANSSQYRILLALVLVFITFFGVLEDLDDLLFQPFFGGVPPLVVAVSIVILGIGAFSILLAKRWFVIHRKVRPSGWLWYSLVTILFAFVAILVDWNIVYPEDMNILFPESLLFYPAMGFLVEILFHILPLALLIPLLRSGFKSTSHRTLVWAAILVVAALEPTYQIYMDPYPTWALLVVWTNLYLFNVLQLMVLRRYDFLSMYALRLVYYLFWHILWGSMRLELLF